MKNRDQPVSIAIPKVAGWRLGILTAVLALVALVSVGIAETEDHVVIVRESSSVEQIVEQELDSSKFAKQIATYNGIATISTILPAGTSLQIPKPYLLNRDFGRVAFVKGDVTHTQKDFVVNPPSKGSRVFNGDVFSTGEDGFVSLRFNSGASVNLQPESRVSVVDIDCVDAEASCVIKLSADKGEVHSEITPRPEGQPEVKFSVETPFISAAVRGTAFYVDVDQNVNKIGVTRGLVTANSNGATNDLPKGKGMVAVPGEAPSVVDLLAPPVMSEQGGESVLFSMEDRISWNDVEGAAKYRYMVSSDPSMINPDLVQEVDSSSAFPNVDAVGEYFVSIVAIDDQGFLGLPLNTSFKYVDIEDVEPLELLIQRVGAVAEVSVPGYDGPVELQMSNSINGSVVERLIVNSMSEGITLDLNTDSDWVFRARKVMSETAVSRYGNEYLLRAAE